MNILKIIKNHLLMISITLLFVVITLIVAPVTRSPQAIANIFTQSFAPAILGWGVYYDLKVGNWDFSVGANILLSSIIAGNLALRMNAPVIVLILLCVLISLGLGTIAGVTFRLLRIPSIICTMGILLIYESLSAIIFDGRGVMMSSNYIVLGRFPNNVIMVVIAFVIAYIFTYRLKIGYAIKAVGSNPVVASSNGLDIYKIKMIAMILCSIFAGFYAAMSLCTSGAQRAVGGMQTMVTCFNAMMCVFTSFAIIGRGNQLIAIYFGAVIVQMIKLLLLALNFPSQYNQIVIAVLVVLLMMASINGVRLKQFFAKFKIESV